MSLVCLFVCLSVPPSIYPPEDEIHIVSANQSQSLSCLVSGYPTPRIQWHRDGVHIDSDTHLRYGLRVSIEGFFVSAGILLAGNTCIPAHLLKFTHLLMYKQTLWHRKCAGCFVHKNIHHRSSYYAEEGE